MTHRLDRRINHHRTHVMPSPEVAALYFFVGGFFLIPSVTDLGGEGPVTALYFMLGAVFVFAGVVEAWRWAQAPGMTRAGAARRSGRTEGWQADPRWSGSRVLRSGLGERATLMIGVGLIVAGTLLWEWPRVGAAERSIAVIWEIMLAVAAAALGYGLVTRWRARRHAEARLVLQQFPLRLGEEARMRFVGGRALAGAAEVRIELRCIEGSLEGWGKHRRQVSDLQWMDERVGDLDASGGADLSFRVPADLPASRPMPRFGGDCVTWELYVAADVPGLDYRDAFLLPVYAPVESGPTKSTPQEATP